jgi:D-glycero-D-manno-heptose 1,7-bisphosphate phosphatase
MNDKMDYSPPTSDALIDDEGVWCQVFSEKTEGALRPALFLDRDGVVIEDAGYLHNPEDLRLINGASSLIKKARNAGIVCVLVTNQAGIAYGKYGWEEFSVVQKKLLEELAKEGAFLDGVYACPHHQTGKPPFNHPDHPARKPNPGMLLKGARDLDIDLSASWLIGDKSSDILAAKNAGLAGAIHVKTGHGENKAEQKTAQAIIDDEFQVFCAPSIKEAAELLTFLA